MALYIGDKKYAVTKALYRGFYMVVVHGFAGTTVTCAGTTLYIGSNESVIFKIIEPGTYTFVANRKGETKTETLVLDPKTSQYSYNIGMYLGMQLVEYLEASDTQYIDTGVVPHPGYSVEMTFQFTSITPDDPEVSPSTQICGVRQTGNSDRFYPIAVGNDVLRSCYGNTEISYSASENFLKHTVRFNKNGHIYLDDVDKGATSGYVEPENPQYTMYLFKWNYGETGPSDPVCKMRIFSYKMWDNNGDLILDLVPVLDNTLQGCFYDRVSQQMYYNAGTGEFITGPSMAYDELVYIETDPLHERQWIDSEYIPNNKSAIEYNVQLLEVPNGRYVFGNYDTNSQYYVYTNNSTSKWEFGWSSAYTTSSNNRDTNFHSFYLYTDNGTSFMKCDGNVVSSASTVSQIETHTLPLISGRNNGTSTEVGITLHQKFFGCKIWDDDTLVRDLIPVKRKTGEVCMWDKVEEKFYYNKGTGNFIDGPVKSYTELEYLESDGTQWIDTGFHPDNLNTTRFMVMCQFTGGESSDWLVNGISSRQGTGFYVGMTDTSRNQFVYLYDATDVYTNVSVPDRFGLYTYDYNGPEGYFKVIGGSGTLVNASLSTITPSTKPSIVIFGYNNRNEDGSPNPRSEKIYTCKIYDGSTLVRDFVPVKRSDNVLGMLDKVNNKFYWNLGTGNFIAGRVIDHTELEWIESTGEQYIDTGIKPTSNTQIDIKYLVHSLGSDGYASICGSLSSDDGTFIGWAQPWYINNVNRSTSTDFNLDTQYTDSLSGTTWIHNGITFTVNSVTANNLPMYIFCRNRQGTPNRLHGMYLYYMKIYNNGNLIQDLVPVKRNTDNVVCLFDKVTRTYFENAGTGEFIAGPVKSN